MTTYKKKYYKSIVSSGNTWKLEIYQDTPNNIDAKEIGGVLQGLRLYMQGDQANVDTPIVKTSLEMIFADAPDLETNTKCGDWEEFYTSSATEYKVLLYKNDVLEWTGYITPDSFSEDLQYHGSITLIARDNLGTLQDFEYKMQGDTNMLQFKRLIDAAKNAISFPMEIEVKTTGSRRLPYTTETDSKPYVDEIFFNEAALVGKNWLEIIEGILFATGLTLRYVGQNKFMLAPMRDMPLYNFEYWADVPVKPVTFLSFGHRELTPAAKEIKDVIVFDLSDNVALVHVIDEDFGNEKSVIAEVVEKNWVTATQRINIPVHELNSESWSSPSLEKSMFLNHFACKLVEEHSSTKYGDLRGNDVVYLAANLVEKDSTVYDSKSAIYRQEVAKGKYKLSFVVGQPAGFYDELMTKIGFDGNDYVLGHFRYKLRFVPNNPSEKILSYHEDTFGVPEGWYEDYEWYINDFIPEEPNNILPVNFGVPEFDIPSNGMLELEIVNMSVAGESNTFGKYVQIKDLKIEDLTAADSPILEKTNIRTKYDARNSLILTRDPKFGFNMPTPYGTPAYIQNGMYIADNKNWYIPSDKWVFYDKTTSNPLTVLIHQQLLMYYSKPNNILTGELATEDPTFNALYHWKGANHLILSGALNILTGRMEGAVLRQFSRYDYLWETYLSRDAIDVSVEGEEIVQFMVYSHKEITLNDITNVPDWIILRKIQDTGVDMEYDLEFGVLPNERQPRTAYICIDGAYLRVSQGGADIKDYSNDYSNDYY